MMSKKKALVLSGGSVKGAFQVGAIEAVLESGFEPDTIYGISVGALNGTFVCAEAGKMQSGQQAVNWRQIGENLAAFWKNNIKQPSDIVSPRWLPTIVKDVLFDSFDGLVGTTPLRELVEDTISLKNILASPVGLRIGTTNLLDGTLIITDPSNPDFIDYMLASASIPIMMPLSRIGGQILADGGVREIAPLRPAIRDGASEIVAITCQPKQMGSSVFDPRNLLQLIERTFDIMTNAIVDDDMAWADFINKLVEERDSLDNPFTSLREYRKIDILSIRPEAPLTISISSFSSDDIQRLIDAGYDAAVNALHK